MKFLPLIEQYVKVTCSKFQLNWIIRRRVMIFLSVGINEKTSECFQLKNSTDQSIDDRLVSLAPVIAPTSSYTLKVERTLQVNYNAGYSNWIIVARKRTSSLFSHLWTLQHSTESLRIMFTRRAASMNNSWLIMQMKQFLHPRFLFFYFFPNKIRKLIERIKTLISWFQWIFSSTCHHARRATRTQRCDTGTNQLIDAHSVAMETFGHLTTNRE